MKRVHLQCYKHCRWCGIGYHANLPKFKDGFHSAACKQAHYRAYKNYVTAKSTAAARTRGRQVTQKKRKKRV